MILSKGLTRLGSTVALAALLLSAGFAFASTAHAQAPHLLYGPAASGTTAVVVLVDGAVCETANVDMEASSSTGYLWVAQIDDGECGASTGAAISFTVDGAAANETATWAAGGAPADTAVGITLTTSGGGGTTPTPPDTGDAGLAGSSASSPWLALGLGALAVAMLAGARTATNRSR